MIENGWNETRTRVRYKDTDKMGVVYYGNYFTFFEMGRSEFMRALGLPYSELEKMGYNLVVIETAAKYHSNVGYDAHIGIRTSLTEVRNVKIGFAYEIVSEEGTLLVTGSTTHGCLNSNGKPARIPQDLKDILLAHLEMKVPHT